MKIKDLIEKIKNIFTGNIPKQLTDETERRENFAHSQLQKEAFAPLHQHEKFSPPLQQQRKKLQDELQYTPQTQNSYSPTKLDSAIQQFLSECINEYQQYGQVNAYGSLTHLWVPKEFKEPGANMQNEQALLNYLKNNSNYTCTPQLSNDGTPAFYHIKSKNYRNYNTASTNDVVRLYLLVNRKNIASLSSEMIKEFANAEFYFKFNSDSQYNQSARSESIVMYVHKDQIDNTLNVIQKIKETSPMLFEKKSSVGNQFLKSVFPDDDTVKYAPEVDNKYTDIFGKTRTIANSFNSKLSVALGESIIHAVTNMCISDPKFKDNMSIIQNDLKYLDLANGSYRHKINNILGDFIRLAPELDKDNLISQIKSSLITATKRNELDIIKDKAIIKDDKNMSYMSPSKNDISR